MELADRSRPRLLLVDKKAEPPVCTDILEDWIRLPVAAADIRARVRGLETRVVELTPHIPFLNDAGTVEYRFARVGLSPLQARLISPLIDQFDAVVSRETLAQIGWPDGNLRTNTLDVHMMRLRRRFQPLELQIRTVRSRGFLLADADSDF
jgi:DNA-binding response OmpR family regulator